MGVRSPAGFGAVGTAIAVDFEDPSIFRCRAGVAIADSPRSGMGVDFTIVDPFGEQEDVRGRVGFGGASVTLEIEALRGRGVWRKVVIGVEEFATCRFRRGILGARLQLRTADEGALGGVPGVVDDSVTLQFARTDREAAAALADRLATAIADLSSRSSLVRVFDWSSSQS